MTELPAQLQNGGFRFVKIRKAEKGAFEKGWERDANYDTSCREFADWLNGGGNYGVIGGYANLIIIDADSEQIKECCRRLPRTFAVRTPGHGGGEHYYFICPEWKGNEKFKSGDEDLGQIQAENKYVVGPGCIHPNGGKYEVMSDAPIAEVSAEDIGVAFADWLDRRMASNTMDCHAGLGNLPLSRLLDVSKYQQKHGKPNCYFGPHPVHGSSGGTNFHFDLDKNVWYCFRHDVGGGPFQLLAMIEGVLSCSDLKEKKLKGTDFVKVMDIAQRKYGVSINDNMVQMLASGLRDKATEELVSEIESMMAIRTTRDDEKPEMWVYKDGIFIPNGESIIREYCRKKLGLAFRNPIAADVIAKIMADTYINADDFFNRNEKWEIPVRNGVLNLKTRELSEFTPEKVFFAKVPIDYCASAECPNIDSHFRTVLKYEEDVPVLYELFGYCLLKEQKFEVAFMFLGDGRNGKGKTLSLLKTFLGVENCSAVSLQALEKDQFAAAELFGKLANICGDLPKEALRSTERFKTLTGRDMVSLSRKFLPMLHTEIYAKLIFAANELPGTCDYTRAFWDRWILLEFPYTFVSRREYENAPDKKMLKIRDEDILDKLATDEELSGLLNKALDGLDKLIANRVFSHSRSSAEIEDIWIRKSDSFAAFFKDWLVEEWNEKILKADLRKYYSAYCAANKVRQKGDKAIMQFLSEHGVGSGRITEECSQIPCWDGIRFKEDIDNLLLIAKSSKDSKDSNGFSSLV